VQSDEMTTCDYDLEKHGTAYPIEIITTWDGPDFTHAAAHAGHRRHTVHREEHRGWLATNPPYAGSLT
jgi:hypothetical protein